MDIKPPTEKEYYHALNRSRDENTPAADAEAYNQLCRGYRGQIFIRTAAEHALAMLRKGTADGR